MMRPPWMLHPVSIAIAVGAGFVVGAIEAWYNERDGRYRQAKVREQARVYDPMAGTRSRDESTDSPNGTTADSGVPVQEMPSVAFYEQKPDQEEK